LTSKESYFNVSGHHPDKPTGGVREKSRVRSFVKWDILLKLRPTDLTDCLLGIRFIQRGTTLYATTFNVVNGFNKLNN